MKTLKLGALALGMMFAGSAMAMDDQKAAKALAAKALYEEVSNLYVGILHAGNLLTADQQSYVDLMPGTAFTCVEANNIERLKELKGILEDYTHDVRVQQANGKVAKANLITRRFVATHPKSLGAVALVTVFGLGYVAYKQYKKYAAKQKKIEIEETEDETETVA